MHALRFIRCSPGSLKLGALLGPDVMWVATCEFLGPAGPPIDPPAPGRLCLAHDAAFELADRDALLLAVFESDTVGVTETDADDGRFLRVNQRFCDMTGRTEAELLGGLRPEDVVRPEFQAAMGQERRSAVRTHGRWDAEVCYSRPDGTGLWARVGVVVSRRAPDGQALRLFGLVQDLTGSRAAEERLHESEEFLHLSMQAGHIGTFRHHFRKGLIECGPEARSLHALPAGEAPVPQSDWLHTILPEDRQRLREQSTEAFARTAPDATYHYRIHHAPRGQMRHIEVRTRYNYDLTGQPVSAIGVVIDVTESREAQALLSLSLEVGGTGDFRHDLLCGLVHIGPGTRKIYGLPPTRAVLAEHDWFAALVPEDQPRLQAYITRQLARRDPHGAVDYRIQAGGQIRHIQARTRIEYGLDGTPLRALGMVIDVTEQREAEARIAHIAHHDALTGLPNRLMFRQRIEALLPPIHEGAARTEGTDSAAFAMLCLDLDHFKDVNDTLGHHVGDALLCDVSKRLLGALRKSDVLARLGGDEFAIIAACTGGRADIGPLADRLVQVIATPFDIEGHMVTVSLSIGIALAPDDGPDGETLLRSADLALYRAKADGRGRWLFFEPEMNARSQLRRHMELDLRRALPQDEFELFY